MQYRAVVELFQSTYNSNDGITLNVPVFLGREREYFLDTINSTFVSTVGSYVDRAEKMMAEISQKQKAVMIK